MAMILLLGMIMIIFLASSALAQTINGLDYWPLNVGNFWEYRNVENGYITKIHVIGKTNTPQGIQYTIRFTKNNASTYWGVGTNWWIDLKLIDDGITIWSPSYVLYKDGMEIGRSTSSSTITMSSTDPRYPPYIFLHDSIDLSQPIFYGLTYQSTEWGIGYGGWLLRYNIVGVEFMWVGFVLRMQIDEPVWIPSIGKAVIYEDWCFWQGVGPVIIEQFSDANRNNRTVRIELINYLVN